MLLATLLATAAPAQKPADKPFPEPTLAMIETCLNHAVKMDMVTQDGDSWKYICGDEPAKVLWDHLVALKTKTWEQTVPEGIWLSREFPLGGCFKRLKKVDGTPAANGLSCTIWVPRK